MKYLIITIITLVSVRFSNAQSINWSSIETDQKHLVYLNFGYDFGIVTQVGYGYKVETFRPVLLTADYLFPMGKNIVDDFKVRLGGQISIYEIKNFVFSAKVYALFRRHETKLVSMSSFGAEIAAAIGYYKPTWHVAVEFGFDKSISTYLKHSVSMKENFPEIKDGWFVPSGGYFFFGAQGSKTIGNNFEVSLRLGGTNSQAKDENPLLPFYGQLGLVYRFLSS